MKPDDEAAGARDTDDAGATFEWPDAPGAAREAALGRLASLRVEEDPTTAGVLGSELAGIVLRSVDDELASLVYDSNVDLDLFRSVRAEAATSRQMTFEARELVLELEVSATRHLVGQVVPPQTAVVELRHRGGTMPFETDGLGCFDVAKLPEGPVSFRCRPSDPAVQAVATSWITL